MRAKTSMAQTDANTLAYGARASRCIMEMGAREGLPKLSDLHKM